MIRKRDLWVIGALLLAAVLLMGILQLIKKPGGEITVTVDGELYGVYALSGDREIRIRTEEGENLLMIENGEARMEHADCPRGLCREHAPVSRRGETIVCLPHRVVAEVTGGDDASYDALTH